MPSRPRRTRYTVYGNAHRLARTAAVAAYKPGQPCAIGGEPLWLQPAWLDLAHNADHTGYLGLSCRYHNRSEGARKANRMRGMRRHPERYAARWTPSRNW